MGTEKIRFDTSHGSLEPDPIHTGWVLAGNPVTRSKFISRGGDGRAIAYIWECTAGRFHWEYPVDETVYLIEGSVTVKDHRGVSRTANAGDTIFFPAGTRAEWSVARYVRKFALAGAPIRRSLLLQHRMLRFLKRIAGGAEGIR